MNISAFDLNRAKALHFLLEEAHVGRAAAHLGITAAAASNALRRLREDLGDPLLARKGRGLVRTRVGEELRGPAREVVAAAEVLLRRAKPFEPSTFQGELQIALADHVAAILLPGLDLLARERAPRAKLIIAAVPLDVAGWLQTSGGVLVGPAGPFAATTEGDGLQSGLYYSERYLCVMRQGHPLSGRRLTTRSYADQGHVLVTPRGLTFRSDVDDCLAARGLSRRVERIVPSFELATRILLQSDLITTMPERSARQLSHEAFTIREMPLKTPPLPMLLIVHPAHEKDGRTRFIKRLLHDTLLRFDEPRA